MPEQAVQMLTDTRDKVGSPAAALLREANRQLQRLTTLADTPTQLRQTAREQIAALELHAQRTELAQTPITALKAVAGGLRLVNLERAGYRTVADVLGASPYALDEVPGVGPRTAQQITTAAENVAQALREGVRIRLDPDRRSGPQTRLLATLAALRAAEDTATTLDAAIPSTTSSSREYAAALHSLLERAEPTASRWRLLLTGPRRKTSALQALTDLQALLEDPATAALRGLLAAAPPSSDPGPAQLWQHLQTDAASIAAQLAALGADPTDTADAARGHVPEELRQQITAVPLDTRLLTATLRGYQVFGAQHIIHQQRSILGDEMGLGKTVQALAAIAHLAARGQTRFLVVCPASVQINWLNETRKHTRLPVHSLHGEDRDRAAARWLATGGVAVTTFGTLARLPAQASATEVAMLVVDEAHYVKNPGTARGRCVAAAAATAQRVLFLTGTPMENRVAEFRSLVSYLQPQLAAELDATDTLAGAHAFRRAVAPVYLRRNQADVLTELPGSIETEDWVRLSGPDRTAYAEAVRAGDLMGMRQAAYASPSSAKLTRLLEIVEDAAHHDAKVVIFSFFHATLATTARALGDAVVGTVTGAVPPARRQLLVDELTLRPGHAVLLSQIEAGGVGMNMQAASVVIIAEPAWKPSTEQQAIARALRMGQLRTVRVHRLLALDSVDERMREIQQGKTLLFDGYARRSAAKEADPRAVDTAEHRPPDLDDDTIPLQRRVILAERHRLAPPETVPTSG